jgi:hypothetical protein
LSEATIVFATIIRSFCFELRPDYPIRPLLRITMRPDGGLPMRLRPRTLQLRPALGRRSAA